MDVQYKTSRDRHAEPIQESVVSFIANRIKDDPDRTAVAVGQLVEVLLVRRVITFQDVARIFSKQDDYEVKLA